MGVWVGGDNIPLQEPLIMYLNACMVLMQRYDTMYRYLYRGFPFINSDLLCI